MSDRRTFLGNAAAAAVIAKISPLRSFGFTSDGPQTIHPTISDREKAGLRGPVKQYTEETIISGIEGDKPCPAREICMEDAIRNAERILQKIDERWPTEATEKALTS